MMNLIFANKGVGKTTLLAKIAHSKKNRRKYDMILSNVPIKDTYRIDVKDIGKIDIRKSLILIDEAGIEHPNTKPMPSYQTEFYKLSRHYLCDIYFVSQSWEDINIVIRRLYDKIFFLKKMMLYPISYTIQIKKQFNIDETTKQPIDEYVIVPRIPFITVKYIFRPLYYKYFDSYDAPKLKEVEFEKW